MAVDYGAFLQPDSGEVIILNSPGEQAGLQAGDVIIKVNDIQLQDISLAQVLRQYSPGDIVQLTIVRQEEELKLSVTLGKM